MKPKIIFLGMNNPQGNPPFWHEPRGSAGDRLFRIGKSYEGMPFEQWRGCFDFRNVLSGAAWSTPAAKRALPTVREGLRDRRVVMVGQAVAKLFRLTTDFPCYWVQGAEFEWAFIPHPSGLNRWYNDERNVTVVRQFFKELYREWV